MKSHPGAQASQSVFCNTARLASVVLQWALSLSNRRAVNAGLPLVLPLTIYQEFFMSNSNNSANKDQKQSQENDEQLSSEEKLPPEIRPSKDPQSEFSVAEELKNKEE